MTDDDEVCFCGELMKNHTAWGSCTSPRAMPPPDPTSAEAHNAWLDELLADIESEPLRDFLNGRLREVPEPPA